MLSAIIATCVLESVLGSDPSLQPARRIEAFSMSQDAQRFVGIFEGAAFVGEGESVVSMQSLAQASFPYVRWDQSGTSLAGIAVLDSGARSFNVPYRSFLSAIARERADVPDVWLLDSPGSARRNWIQVSRGGRTYRMSWRLHEEVTTLHIEVRAEKPNKTQKSIKATTRDHEIHRAMLRTVSKDLLLAGFNLYTDGSGWNFYVVDLSHGKVVPLYEHLRSRYASLAEDGLFALQSVSEVAGETVLKGSYVRDLQRSEDCAVFFDPVSGNVTMLLGDGARRVWYKDGKSSLEVSYELGGIKLTWRRGSAEAQTLSPLRSTIGNSVALKERT